MSKLALTNGNYIYISPSAETRSEILAEVKKRFKRQRAAEKRFFEALFTSEVCGEKFRENSTSGPHDFMCALAPGHDGEHVRRAKRTKNTRLFLTNSLVKRPRWKQG